MSRAQETFEAVMRVNGYTDFTMKNGRYTAANIQVRWKFFQLGWNMADVNRPIKTFADGQAWPVALHTNEDTAK